MPLKRAGARAGRRGRPTAPALAGAANTLVLEDGAVGWPTTPTCPARSPRCASGTTARSTAATVLGGGATAASPPLALCDLGAARGAGCWPATPGAGRGRPRPRSPRTRGARGRGAARSATARRRRRPGLHRPGRARRTTRWSPRCPTSRCVLRRGLRPVADAARRVARRPTGCWSPGWTCWCTRRCSSSSCSPGCPGRSTRCARPARRRSPPRRAGQVNEVPAAVLLGWSSAALGGLLRARVIARVPEPEPDDDPSTRSRPTPPSPPAPGLGRWPRWPPRWRRVWSAPRWSRLAAALPAAASAGLGRARRRRPAHPPAADRRRVADVREWSRCSTRGQRGT